MTLDAHIVQTANIQTEHAVAVGSRVVVFGSDHGVVVALTRRYVEVKLDKGGKVFARGAEIVAA